jgi:cobyrinic acid a,c-diamide synthase
MRGSALASARSALAAAQVAAQLGDPVFLVFDAHAGIIPCAAAASGRDRLESIA